jgi:hypothetical protein
MPPVPAVPIEDDDRMKPTWKMTCNIDCQDAAAAVVAADGDDTGAINRKL